MIKNILVIRNDRFGEFLLIIPALCALKENFSGAKITIAVSPDVEGLAGYVECADYVIVWENRRHTLREVIGFSAELKKKKFDLAVVFNPTKEAHLISFLAKIPKRTGFNRKWGILLTDKTEDKKHLAEKHEVEYNLELAGLAGADNQEIGLAPLGSALPRALRPRSLLFVPRNDKYEFLAKAIAIHPFTSDPVKHWPVERFMELAKRIAREMKVKVVLVGKKDRGQSPSTEGSPERSRGTGTVPLTTVPLTVPLSEDGEIEVVDLINKTSLVELAQVLKQCRLLVTCDSGPMHLAAAVGTPVVALFRNDLPGKTARRWGPWGVGNSVIEKDKLLDITVEEVFRGVVNKIQGQSPDSHFKGD